MQTRRWLLRLFGLAAAAPVVAKAGPPPPRAPTDYLGPGHVSADPMVLGHTDFDLRMAQAEIALINSVPDIWLRRA